MQRNRLLSLDLNELKKESHSKIDFAFFDVLGRDDCVALYSGQSNGNWETVSCYEERPYVCEIPEGKALAATPIDPGLQKIDYTGSHSMAVNMGQWFPTIFSHGPLSKNYQAY